jgi:hypothetical protein
VSGEQKEEKRREVAVILVFSLHSPSIMIAAELHSPLGEFGHAVFHPERSTLRRCDVVNGILQLMHHASP